MRITKNILLTHLLLLGMLGADPITEEVKKAATAKAEKQEKTEKKKSAKKK